jgi:hypothetical protein
LVGKATTDTLTNKTYNTKGTGNVFTLNGVAFGTATEATAALNAVVGDSGSGGTKGLVPAPASGDAAAGKFLKADGTFAVPPGTGGGGSLSDTDRQNIILNAIYQSKLFAGYRRFINAFADGYKASDGVNSGSSSNYSVDTSGGKVSPTVNASTTGTFGNSSTGGGGRTVSAAGGQNLGFQFTAPASGTVTGVRITIISVSSGGNWVAKLYTNNSGSPGTQIGSDSGSVSVSGAGTSVFTFGSPPSITNATVYWIVLAPASGSPDMTVDTCANDASYGSGRNGTITSITNSLPSSEDWRLEVDYSTGANAMTLVTTSQTADSTVGTGRVLIEFDNTATPTLNTDITVEITCDNGSHWTSASLSSVSTNGQGGRKIAETVDQAIGTSGTSFAARIKTFNSKSIPIYGLNLTVH